MNITAEYKKTKAELIDEIINLNNKFDDFHLYLLSNYELQMIVDLLKENERLKKGIR